MWCASFICVLVCMCVCAQQHCNEGSTTETSPHSSCNPVTRSQSGVFHGSWWRSRRGRQFQAYRGIPYAEHPVGELRFKPPKLIEHYTREVNATEEGPACPQPTYGDYYKLEECLRLNVYTPGKTGDKLHPVVVFIHAGGFYSLSGRSDVAGPEYLLDRDLVLVTINYRLASLGFLSTGDSLAPGNNGFKDQVAALKWVQRNIAAFGGDPNLVTISGYSAGSFSVMLHMISPMSKGLFHRAISMSGSPLSQVVTPRAQPALATRQAQLLNCTTHNTRDMFDCLKERSATELGDSLDGMFEFGYDPILIWLPLVEEDFGQERFLTGDPVEAVRQGNMNPVPLIISQTTDEFFWKAFDVLENETRFNTMKSEWERIAPISFLLPAHNSSEASRRVRQAYLEGKPMARDDATAKGLGKLYSDGVIGFGVHRMANLMCRHSPHAVFYSEFGYIGNYSHYRDPKTKKPVGVAHHDDLLYLFNVSTLNPAGVSPSDTLDSMMIDKMTAMWYNFARYGDPNPVGDTPELGSLQWPPMEPDQRHYLRVDTQLTVHQNLFEDRFKLWDELYPIIY